MCVFFFVCHSAPQWAPALCRSLGDPCADCAAIGHPILGDDIYGDDAEGGRLHLHAKALRFAEPSSGDTWTVESASGFR